MGVRVLVVLAELQHILQGMHDPGKRAAVPGQLREIRFHDVLQRPLGLNDHKLRTSLLDVLRIQTDAQAEIPRKARGLSFKDQSCLKYSQYTEPSFCA